MKVSASIASLSLSVLLCSTATCGAIANSGIDSPALEGKLFRGKVSYQLIKAEQLLSQRKYDEAKAIFQKEISHNSKNVDAITGLAMALTMQFKLDAADEQFDKVLAIDPNNAFAHAGKAIVLLDRLQSSSKTVIDSKSQYLAKAENEAKQSVTKDPDLQYGHYALGKVLKEQGKLPEAYREYQEAVVADPQFSPAYTDLGLIDLKQNNPAEASLNFNKAIQLNSSNSTAHYGLGEVYLRQGQTDAAIKELNTSLYQFRNSAPVQLALGKAYEAQGNYKAALKAYERAALIKPELKEAYSRQANLHLKLGNGYQQKGNVVGAIKEFKQAILIDPYNPAPYLAMANMREARGDLELAISDMRSGLELNPNQVQLRQRVANNLLKLDKLDDAIKEYRRALSAQPNNSGCIEGLTTALYLKAQKVSQGAFLASNDYDTALDTIKQAIKQQPNNLQLRLAEAKIKALSGEKVDLSTVGQPRNKAEKIAYAEALLAQNKFNQSSQMMASLIHQTDDPKQLLALSDLALMLKDVKSADAGYKKAAGMPGNERRARRGLLAVEQLRKESNRCETLGHDLARRKQLPSAIDNFKQAIESDPRAADARLGLADAERRLGRKSPELLKDSALQYRAYIDLRPDLPAKEVAKLTKTIEKLNARAAKLEAKIASGQETVK